MAKYRKKPVVIDAIQFTGDNDIEIMNLFSGKINRGEHCLHIHTLEGVMRAEVGDWIIKGVAGELYPCKPDIFEKTYEKV